MITMMIKVMFGVYYLRRVDDSLLIRQILMDLKKAPKSFDDYHHIHKDHNPHHRIVSIAFFVWKADKNEDLKLSQSVQFA